MALAVVDIFTHFLASIKINNLKKRNGIFFRIKYLLFYHDLFLVHF